jgi:hypothetical protein
MHLQFDGSANGTGRSHLSPFAVIYHAYGTPLIFSNKCYQYLVPNGTEGVHFIGR